MKIKILKLDERAKMPTLGSQSAAGADIYALEGFTVAPGETVLAKTGRITVVQLIVKVCFNFKSAGALIACIKVCAIVPGIYIGIFIKGVFCQISLE